MGMKTAEPILVERAAGGDREAFSALVETHWTPLVSLARSVVGDAEAEDAVQDALVKAWHELGQLRDRAAFAAWLRRIVVRGCLGRTRRLLMWRPLAEAPERVVETDTDAALDVARLLAVLAPRQRAVMHLTVVEGMSDSEIAAVLEIAPASVRSHRRRARQSLDHVLSPLDPRKGTKRQERKR